MRSKGSGWYAQNVGEEALPHAAVNPEDSGFLVLHIFWAPIGFEPMIPAC
ncbi:hypothetical protein GCM10025779_24220 [Arthrobacter cryoconiti]